MIPILNDYLERLNDTIYAKGLAHSSMQKKASKGCPPIYND